MLANGWDREAETFDAAADHGLLDPEVRNAWRRLLLDALPTDPSRAIDLGCGTGSLSVLLAEAGHQMTGLDFSPRMIEKATRKAASAGVDAEFLVGDASALVLARHSYDVVLARHLLWAMPDADEALTQWFELLRPSGMLVLIEGLWHTGSGISAAEAERLVRRHRCEVSVRRLDNPILWGGPITDERYLLVA